MVTDALLSRPAILAARVGPRWGVVQGDGKVFAIGILYASYLGGDEGYTATSSDGGGTSSSASSLTNRWRRCRLAQSGCISFI